MDKHDNSLLGCIAARGFWALDRLIGGDARRSLCRLGVEQIDTLVRAVDDIAAEGAERGWTAEASLRRRVAFAVKETASDVLDVALDRAEAKVPGFNGSRLDRWLTLQCIELHRAALAAKGSCPTCKEPNRLTRKDVALGYQCDVCADFAEGRCA